MRCIIGGIVGFVLGVMATAHADGWMYGWQVKIGNHVICGNPYIWQSVNEIECERR